MNLLIFESPLAQCIQGGFKQSVAPLNFPGSWCIRNMVQPFITMLSSPGVYETVLEITPIVRINSLRGTMPLKDLLFKAQNGVLGSSMRHRVGLQLSSGGF